MATEVATSVSSLGPVDYCVLGAGTAVTWIYTIELILTIFLNFEYKEGLYFWSLLVSLGGLTLHALGLVLEYLVEVPWYVSTPLITTGGVAMVAGQAFVLYSRLHLVIRSRSTLRTVLYLMVIELALTHIPTLVLAYSSNPPNAGSEPWKHKYKLAEKLQLGGDFVRDVILSMFYIWSSGRNLKLISHSATKKAMHKLIIINCLCIAMNGVLIFPGYSNHHIVEASIRPMIYAMMLKLEFTILNQLMVLARNGLTDDEHRGQTSILYRGENVPSTTNLPFWNSARAVRDAPIELGIELGPVGSVQLPELDICTERIEIFAESAETLRIPEPSPEPGTSQTTSSGDGPKVKSLMGTTYVHDPRTTYKRRSTPAWA